jgi:hypothetical protein
MDAIPLVPDAGKEGPVGIRWLDPERHLGLALALPFEEAMAGTRQRRFFTASRKVPDGAQVSIPALMPDHFFASSGRLWNRGTKSQRAITPSRLSPSR